MKLKNRELEMRRIEDEKRLKENIEEKQKITNATLNQFTEELFKIKQDTNKRLAKLEQQKRNS